MSIAFLGLGSMGSAVAANLLKTDHEVTVWNRTLARAAPLVEAGAQAAATPLEAASDAAVVFTMVADDAALLSVLHGDHGLLAGMAQDTLHVSLSTIAVATADWVAAAHADHGQRFISAPVFGRPEAAAAAKLFIVAAGAGADIDEAEPLFAAIAQKVFRVGETPSHANLVKLCGNFAILSAIETMGEAMALAQKGGVPKATLHEVLTGTLFNAPIYHTYGAILVEERYTPAGFKAPLGLKDMRLAGEAAEKNRVPMPLLSLLRDHLLQTIAQDGEEVDWSAIARVIGRNADL